MEEVDGERGSKIGKFLSKDFVALYRTSIADLSNVPVSKFEGDSSLKGWRYDVQVGDVVIVSDGMGLCGIACVQGPYRYWADEITKANVHARDVAWFRLTKVQERNPHLFSQSTQENLSELFELDLLDVYKLLLDVYDSD